MSGQLLQLGGSLVAVLLLVGLTWLLGFRRPARIASVQEAAEMMRMVPGGFEPAEIALDAEGRAAVARDHAGRLLALVPHGGRFVARALPEDGQPQERDGVLRFESAGRPFTITLGESGWTRADSAVS